MGCINSTPSQTLAPAPTPNAVSVPINLAVPVGLDSPDIFTMPIDTHADLIADCRLIDVYDGDTCTIVFVGRSGRLEKRKFRFWGFNAKEMKQPRNIPEAERVRNKELAVAAKNRLISLIGNGIHQVIFADENKANNYGRLLGRVLLKSGECTGQYVDEVMIREGLAQAYDGGHRDGDETW